MTTIASTGTVTIIIPRSVARPLGILDREHEVSILSEIHTPWLINNIQNRMGTRERNLLRQRLTDAGVRA